MSVWLRLFILPGVLRPFAIHYDTLARKAWRSILVSTVGYVICLLDLFLPPAGREGAGALLSGCTELRRQHTRYS